MVLFAFELIFAGMFRIQNVPQEHMQPMLMIECPRLLFPFAREIIATAVRNGGFPPLCSIRSISSRSISSGWRRTQAQPPIRSSWRASQPASPE